MNSTCRSCGASVRWARTASGKAMPLDSEPTADGNVQLAMIGGEEIAIVLAAADRAAAQIAGSELFTTHFATCPNAASHRRAS